MRLQITALLFASMAWPSCFAQTSNTTTPPANATRQESPYVPVHEFDSKRDAAADIRAAVAEARRTRKRIILYIGGLWCPYCHQMDELFQKNPDLLQLRETRFITVTVHYGSGNNNDQALSAYTKVLGVPHFFVLESDGTLLHSQHVLDLRADGAYSPAKIKEFLKRWAYPDHLELHLANSNLPGADPEK
jgi:thioredoxin-related protein